MPQGKDHEFLGLDFQILPLMRSTAASPPPPPHLAPPAPPKAPTLAVTSAGLVRQEARNTQDALSHTGGLFSSARAALTWLAVIQGARLTPHVPHIRRGPDGFWWVELLVPWHIASVCVTVARGRPYAGHAPLWVAIPMDGTPPHIPATLRVPSDGTILLEDPDQTRRLAPEEWPDASPRDLLSGMPLVPQSAPMSIQEPLHETVIVTTGTLGRAILRRIAFFDCETTITIAERTLLNDTVPPATNTPIGSLLLHLRGRGGKPLSRACLAYLQSLFYLPATVVAQVLDLEEPMHGHLLVDLRYRSTLVMSLVAALVPAGEWWLLSDDAFGHWRLLTVGEPIASMDLLG